MKNANYIVNWSIAIIIEHIEFWMLTTPTLVKNPTAKPRPLVIGELSHGKVRALQIVIWKFTALILFGERAK